MALAWLDQFDQMGGLAILTGRITGWLLILVVNDACLRKFSLV